MPIIGTKSTDLKAGLILLTVMIKWDMYSHHSIIMVWQVCFRTTSRGRKPNKWSFGPRLFQPWRIYSNYDSAILYRRGQVLCTSTKYDRRDPTKVAWRVKTRLGNKEVSANFNSGKLWEKNPTTCNFSWLPLRLVESTLDVKKCKECICFISFLKSFSNMQCVVLMDTRKFLKVIFSSAWFVFIRS